MSESINYLQVGNVTHCLRCHQDIDTTFEPFLVHIQTIHPYNEVDAPTPCVEKCGKWYQQFDTSKVVEEKTRSRSKYWNTMCDILEGAFPKGYCKERGRALVMLSYIEMMLQGTEFDENGEPILKKK